MPLTEEQAATLQKWLNAKAAGLGCGMCAANDWAPGDIIVPTIRTGGVTLGGPSIPVVMLICGNCAHIELFAAEEVGLL